MGKPTICICENKEADQLRGDREADQRLCFRYSDSTIPLLLKSEISSFKLFPVLVQAGLCQTCSETTLLVFPGVGSFISLCQSLLHLILSFHKRVYLINLKMKFDIKALLHQPNPALSSSGRVHASGSGG